MAAIPALVVMKLALVWCSPNVQENKTNELLLVRKDLGTEKPSEIPREKWIRRYDDNNSDEGNSIDKDSDGIQVRNIILLDGIRKATGFFIGSSFYDVPIEIHLPGYHYCGPGTKAQTRIDSGDNGINDLDRACRAHDIAYQSNDENRRRDADAQLAKEAWEIFLKSEKDSGERIGAYFVTRVMQAKGLTGL